MTAGILVVALLLEAGPPAVVLPTLLRLPLVGVALATILVASRRRRGRAWGWHAALLALLALGLALPLLLRQPDAESWAHSGETRLRRRFEIVRSRVLGIEALLRDLGDRAYALLDSSGAVSALPEERVRLFDALEELVEAAQQRSALGARQPLSVRLFDARGELRGWAGALHASASARRLTHFAPGDVYFQRSGALTFMAYDRRPSAGATSQPGPRVLVETPVQTSFGPRQQRLADRDLAGELSGGGIGVELQYDSQFVPPFLTQADLEILGDPTTSLQGRFVVRGDDGAPRILGRVMAVPVQDEVSRRRAVLRNVQAGLALVALVLALWGLQRWLRQRAGWGRSLVLVASLWAVRALLAWLDLPPARGGAAFGPVAFAMQGAGGMLRSPFDLLLSALALAATATLLFVRRAHDVRRGGAAAPLGSWRFGAGALGACAIAAATVSLALTAAERVAQNSTLPLLGSQLDLSAPAVLCLHGALLAGIGALLLLALLVVSALLPRRAVPWLVVLIATALGGVLWWQTAPLPALCGVALFLGGVHLHALLADDRFTSFALALFALVALTATISSEAVRRDAFRSRQELVLARADEVRRLVEETRPFLLEHVLEDLAADTGMQRDLRFADDVASGALAFEIWAGSLLGGMPWPCQVRVYDEAGHLASEFSIGLPYEQDTDTRDLQARARSQGTIVEQSEIQATPVGSVRLYRGATQVRLGLSGERRGLVVVDLPFAHESLALAANPRLPTPELLRPVGEAGTGPRVDESQLYLLAWLHEGFVIESSTPYLEVGAPLAASKPTTSGWQRLRLVNGSYRVTEIAAGQRTLLAGFQLPKPLDRLLDWTQVAALDFAAAVLLLLALVVLGRTVAAVRVLPPLFVPKRLGFQQKLMGAFLVVALLPSVVLSLATRDIMRERSTSRNRDAALAKARSAEAALSDVVHREIQNLRDSEYLREVLKQETAPPVRDIGNLESSQIMVFHGNSELILDETLSNLSDAEALRFVTDSPRQVFASRDEAGHLYLGLLEPLWFSPETGMSEDPEARLYYLYYRRRLTDDLLRELAPILSTDISGFLGPHLVVSSQKSLAAAGLLPLLVPPAAFQHVLLRDNRYAIVEETAGTQRYFAGYLPLEDRFGQRLGAIAVQQLLQPDEFAVEVERTRALVVGLSTSMFVFTLVLAVAFAARIFDPVRHLIEGTRRIAGGDLGFRLEARAGDEIGELERSFNEMAVRLQSARAALDERRRHLEAVLGNIASGVVATDLEGRVTAANTAVRRILGLEPARLEGRTWQQLQAAASDAGSRGFWSHVGQGRDGESVELSLLRGHDRVTLRVIVTELRPANVGESLGRVAIFEDLTELIRSKKLAAWAEMARQVAHEIKNPLTPLKLSAQFMEQAYRDRSDKFPDIFTEGMQTIVRQVDVLRRIASEFSSFGRMQKLEPKPLDLGGVLRYVTSPYRSMQGLVLDTGDTSNGFPGDGIAVLGDDEGLRKVFSNILENAREAMGGRGRITLRVEKPVDGAVSVRIADAGPGLTDEARSRLFEPYFSTKTTGTGLGLAITRGILEELGGTITLSNRAEGGAEVLVTLTVC